MNKNKIIEPWSRFSLWFSRCLKVNRCVHGHLCVLEAIMFLFSSTKTTTSEHKLRPFLSITTIVRHKTYWLTQLHAIENVKGHKSHKLLQTTIIRYALKKKNGIIWEFFPTWGGGLPKSQNFCKFTKYFFVCQIHSEVLKHV